MAAEKQDTVQISVDQGSPDTSIGGDLEKKGSQIQQYQAGAFETREGHHHYRPIDSYEGIHRWDPEFEWTEEEEKKIVRKVGFSRARLCIDTHQICRSTLVS
jgi:hypothetical protein